MRVDDMKGLPHDFLTFSPAPIYFYTNIGWEVNESQEKVTVTTQKYSILMILVAFVFIEVCLLIGCYYANVYLRDSIDVWGFDIPSAPEIVTTGIIVVCLVILAFVLFAVILYLFDSWIWKNPRLVIHRISKRVLLFDGTISYDISNCCQDIKLLFVSGFVHTPNMRFKYHVREQLYVCVRDSTDIWYRHLIAVCGVIMSTGSKPHMRNNITKLQKMIGCDVIRVKYSSSRYDSPPVVSGSGHSDFLNDTNKSNLRPEMEGD